MSTARIRELNDAYRCHGIGNGRTIYTRSLCDLGVGFKLAALLCVKSFVDFAKDNDPHGEHDFGIGRHQRQQHYGGAQPIDGHRWSHAVELPVGSQHTRRQPVQGERPGAPDGATGQRRWLGSSIGTVRWTDAGQNSSSRSRTR